MATIKVFVARSDLFTVDFTEGDIEDIADEVMDGYSIKGAIYDRIFAAADRIGAPSMTTNFAPVRAAVEDEIAKRAKEGDK